MDHKPLPLPPPLNLSNVASVLVSAAEVRARPRRPDNITFEDACRSSRWSSFRLIVDLAVLVVVEDESKFVFFHCVGCVSAGLLHDTAESDDADADDAAEDDLTAGTISNNDKNRVSIITEIAVPNNL